MALETGHPILKLMFAFKAIVIYLRFIFICLCVCQSVCVYICTYAYKCLWRPKESVRSSGSGVIGGVIHLMWALGTELCFFTTEQVLLVAELSPQPLEWYFKDDHMYH